MLSYLAIKNFAIIDMLELELASGMTVVTGETGAGKSLLVDTLGLALGDRADSSMVKSGAERCEITAIFMLTDLPQAKEWLAVRGFCEEDANASATVDAAATSNNATVTIPECIIHRTFSKDGRSRSSINGISCTLQMVRDLGNMLVDIHGQHEHHSLLKSETQRELLDCYGVDEKLCAAIKQLYTSWQKIQKQFTTLAATAQDSASKIDFVSYQLQELENILANTAELENLKQEHSLLSNAAEIIHHYQIALATANENENNSVLAQLYAIKNSLEKIAAKDLRVSNIAALCDSAIINVEEVVNELRSSLDRVEVNQERLTEIEARLQKIYDLARKHKVKPEELSQVQLQLASQLQELTNADAQLAELQVNIDICANEYRCVAVEISRARYAAAATLSKLVTAKMHELGMPDGVFSVKIIALPEGNFTPYGLENVEFQVSANAGQLLQPLHKVASGGELSRISLALQVILAAKTITPTLIFDEVDVGIGGKTAEIVGNMLCELGESNQVICITHLPQVASCGEHHLVVAKEADATHTTTILTVTPLSNRKARAQEIARMLGGVKITPRTLAHAQEMLEKNYEL